tara:strand:- start:2449 stop:3048 length:600 start_codon:yes stop_codon:yes gene_type:complete
MNKIVNGIKKRETANDVIYTPKPLAKVMIDLCDIKPNDKVLDPSKGGGVFYDNLGECVKDYCEITEDKDFFKYDKPVDIIVGNPPYSLWTKWLEHTIKLNPKKFCYIFGQMNLTIARLKQIEKEGYKMTKIHLCKVDWWFGHSYVCVFDKTESNSIMTYTDIFCCDVCGKRCKRGRTTTKNGVKTKQDPNKCSNIKPSP